MHPVQPCDPDTKYMYIACIPAGLPLWSNSGPGSVRQEPRIHNLFGSGDCRLQGPSSKLHLCESVPLQLKTRIILRCKTSNNTKTIHVFYYISFNLVAVSFFLDTGFGLVKLVHRNIDFG